MKNLNVQSEKFKTNKKVSETIIGQKDKEIELLKKSLKEATKESSVTSSSKRKRLETDSNHEHSKKPKSLPRQELPKVPEETGTPSLSEEDDDSLVSFILDSEDSESAHQSNALDMIDTFTASLTSAREEVEASSIFQSEADSRRSLSPVSSEPFSPRPSQSSSPGTIVKEKSKEKCPSDKNVSRCSQNLSKISQSALFQNLFGLDDISDDSQDSTDKSNSSKEVNSVEQKTKSQT